MTIDKPNLEHEETLETESVGCIIIVAIADLCVRALLRIYARDR